MGFYYSLPTQDHGTDELFYSQLGEILGLVTPALMEDFSCPDWEYHTAMTSKSGKFLKGVEDSFRSKVLSEPSRRGVICIQNCWCKKKKVSRVVTLDFKRANFKILRKLVNGVLWEVVLEDLAFHESWSLFKKHFLKARDQTVPLYGKSSKQNRSPA